MLSVPAAGWDEYGPGSPLGAGPLCFPHGVVIYGIPRAPGASARGAALGSMVRGQHVAGLLTLPTY